MTDFSNFLEKATHANVIPVVETIPADLLTPLAVYLRLSATARNSFLFESVAGGESLARYSFIGAGPDFVLQGDEKDHVISKGGASEPSGGGIYDYLRTHFAHQNAATDRELPSFIGGAIGYLGYGCSEWFEPTLNGKQADNDADPDAAFMFYSSIVAFDHAKQVIKIISLVFCDRSMDAPDLERLYEAAIARNRRIKVLLGDGSPLPPDDSAGKPGGDFGSNWTRPDFESAVSQIKGLICAGECYQVVLSQCFTKETDASPVSVYRALRSLNPSPYMFLLRFDDKDIVGASPEMLVRCENDRLEYRPIAGTRPRGKTSDMDEQLADEMQRDQKEVAEHLMLVDLGRNDLGRVAEYGSVKVETLMSVEKYSHVQHLVSSLSATLRKGSDRFDALAACFPAGTVSGAPKVRAMEVIRDLEPTKRGVYAGAVGYFDYAGNMDTCIAIRTLVLKGGTVRIQAGAGIVADSDPAAEFEETVNKARVLIKAVEIAEGGLS